MPAYGDTPGIKERERERKEFLSAGNKRISLGGRAEE
jgi:hypothetical protein